MVTLTDDPGATAALAGDSISVMSGWHAVVLALAANGEASKRGSMVRERITAKPLISATELGRFLLIRRERRVGRQIYPYVQIQSIWKLDSDIELGSQVKSRVLGKFKEITKKSLERDMKPIQAFNPCSSGG